MKHIFYSENILAVLFALAVCGFIISGGGVVLEARAESPVEDDLRFPDEPPAEPSHYQMSHYRGMVPTSLKGATVVDTASALSLYEAGETDFIDVMPHTPKPPNLPDDMIWRGKVRKNIPRSSWLANIGYGKLPPEMVYYFKENLKKITKGKLHRAVLFYCQQECWMSWNAAKRAMEYGYLNVYWFPLGTDGWLKNGGTVKIATPLPLPQMTRKLTQ